MDRGRKASEAYQLLIKRKKNKKLALHIPWAEVIRKKGTLERGAVTTGPFGGVRRKGKSSDNVVGRYRFRKGGRKERAFCSLREFAGVRKSGKKT